MHASRQILMMAVVLGLAGCSGSTGTQTAPTSGTPTSLNTLPVTAGPTLPATVTATTLPSTANPTPAASPTTPPTPEPPPSLAPQWSLAQWAAAPTGLLFADGSLWVSEHHQSSVIRLDPNSAAIQATIPGVGYQAQKPFEGGGLIWVPSPNLLVAIDPATNTIVRKFPGTFSIVGAYANDHVWLGDGNNSLLELDPTTGATAATVSAPQLYEEDCLNTVELIDNALWWSVRDEDLLDRIDPATAMVTGTVHTSGDSTVRQTATGLWVVSSDGTVKKVDETTNNLTDSIDYAKPQVGACSGQTDASGATLWFLDDSDYSHIIAIDTTNKKLSRIDSGGSDLQDIAIVNGSVWTDLFDYNYVVELKLPTS